MRSTKSIACLAALVALVAPLFARLQQDPLPVNSTAPEALDHALRQLGRASDGEAWRAALCDVARARWELGDLAAAASGVELVLLGIERPDAPTFADRDAVLEFVRMSEARGELARALDRVDRLGVALDGFGYFGLEELALVHFRAGRIARAEQLVTRLGRVPRPVSCFDFPGERTTLQLDLHRLLANSDALAAWLAERSVVTVDDTVGDVATILSYELWRVRGSAAVERALEGNAQRGGRVAEALLGEFHFARRFEGDSTSLVAHLRADGAWPLLGEVRDEPRRIGAVLALCEMPSSVLAARLAAAPADPCEHALLLALAADRLLLRNLTAVGDVLARVAELDPRAFTVLTAACADSANGIPAYAAHEESFLAPLAPASPWLAAHPELAPLAAMLRDLIEKDYLLAPLFLANG